MQPAQSHVSLFQNLHSFPSPDILIQSPRRKCLSRLFIFKRELQKHLRFFKGPRILREQFIARLVVCTELTRRCRQCYATDLLQPQRRTGRSSICYDNPTGGSRQLDMEAEPGDEVRVSQTQASEFILALTKLYQPQFLACKYSQFQYNPFYLINIRPYQYLLKLTVLKFNRLPSLKHLIFN